MQAWAKDQGTPGSMIRLLGDPRSELTKALDLVLDHPGPMSVLGNTRCKRFSLLVKDCKVKVVNVAASDDDPAGDDKPEVSMVDQMLVDLKRIKDEL
jgi:peroxiredoxin